MIFKFCAKFYRNINDSLKFAWYMGFSWSKERCFTINIIKAIQKKNIYFFNYSISATKLKRIFTIFLIIMMHSQPIDFSLLICVMAYKLWWALVFLCGLLQTSQTIGYYLQNCPSLQLKGFYIPWILRY